MIKITATATVTIISINVNPKMPRGADAMTTPDFMQWIERQGPRKGKRRRTNGGSDRTSVRPWLRKPRDQC
jgi:hypothetical protein